MLSMSGTVSLARQLAQTLVGALTQLVRDVRHELSHLHRLTGWQFLNADDNLVIGRSRRGLKQFPKTLYQFPLIFRRPPGPHQKRERGSCRGFSGGEPAARRIVLKDDMHPIFRHTRIFGMQGRQFHRKLGLGVTAECAVLSSQGVERHGIDSYTDVPPAFALTVAHITWPLANSQGRPLLILAIVQGLPSMMKSRPEAIFVGGMATFL